jgi:hypothetical protein
MKSFAAAFAGLVLAAAPALGSDYDATEKSPLYELRLRVPATAMTLVPLKDKILALYKADADQAKSDAKDDKESNPSFNPYSIDTLWRVTFENNAVLSLSAEINSDTGGAHPNQAFQTLVWDKKANRAVPIEALFQPDQLKAALTAIAAAAAQAWNRSYTERSGQKPGPDTDLAKGGIGAEPAKLATFALIHAKGRTAPPTASCCCMARARCGRTCWAISGCRCRQPSSPNISRRNGGPCSSRIYETTSLGGPATRKLERIHLETLRHSLTDRHGACAGNEALPACSFRLRTRVTLTAGMLYSHDQSAKSVGRMCIFRKKR